MKFKELLWEFDESIRDMIIRRPAWSYERIAKEHGVSRTVVLRVSKKFGLKRRWGRKPDVLKQGAN